MSRRNGSGDRSLLGLPHHGGIGGGIGGQQALQNEQLLEAHNDEKLAELSRTVASIKHVSLDIESGVRESNTLLDGVGLQMDSAQALLGNAMQRVQTLSRGASTRTMCQLTAFVVFVFFVLYFLVR